MRWGLVVFLAWQNLRDSRRVTGLLLLAVAAAMAFQVPIEANLTGFHEAMMAEGVHLGEGAVRVRGAGLSRLEGVKAMADTIRALPGVRAVVPLLSLPGAVQRGEPISRCAVHGLDPRTENPPYRLLRGAALAPGDRDGVLLGTEIANELGASVGDEVTVKVFFDRGGPLDDDAMGRYTMTVRGIVAGAFGPRLGAFVDGGFLATEAGLEDEATVLAVYTFDPEAAPAVRDRITGALPQVQARAWREDSGYMASTLGAIDALTAASMAMVIAGVSIPVLALLYIQVLYRRRQVGLLTAIGLGRRDIFAVFVLHATMVAAIALAIGAGVGAALLWWFTAHPIWEWEGFVILPTLRAITFLRPAAIVLVTTTVAGALPAYLACRVDPARVLRGIE